MFGGLLRGRNEVVHLDILSYRTVYPTVFDPGIPPSLVQKDTTYTVDASLPIQLCPLRRMPPPFSDA